jgi:hypothetical protein
MNASRQMGCERQIGSTSRRHKAFSVHRKRPGFKSRARFLIMFPRDSLRIQGLPAAVARESDKRAGARVEAEKASLSGLFAEENEFDNAALWRIGTWGVGAVGAVVLAVLANQSSLGWRREQVAAVDVAHQSQQIQALAKESQNETRRLASAIDALNGDRDRLLSRITVIEQGLDSVTGAIARQGAASKPGTAAPVSPAMTTPLPAPADGASPQPNPSPAQPAAPAVAPVATTASASPAPAADKPRAEPAKPNAAPAANAALPQIASNTSSPAQPSAAQPSFAQPPLAQAGQVPPAAPLAGPRSMIGPPDPAASKLIEPARIANANPAATPSPAPVEANVAAAPKDQSKDQSADPSKDTSSEPSKDQDKPATDADADKATIHRTEFAVELGGANSIPGLRALWRGLLKSNNTELAELHPIIVLHENTTGLGMQLRLAAGPLHDAAAAAKICAALSEAKRPCDTTVFDGQRLAMSAEEEEQREALPGAKPPTAGKPQSYRHYQYRHGKKEEQPPPAAAAAAPQPQSSSFSSLFGLKH